MGLLKIEGVTPWSIPVNDLAESELFYGDLLGLMPLGRLGNSVMSCFNVGDHNILLCQRQQPLVGAPEGDNRLHHSFTVSPETFVQACQVFRERNIRIDGLVYRGQGFFTGRDFTSSIPAGTVSSCVIQRGRKGC